MEFIETDNPRPPHQVLSNHLKWILNGIDVFEVTVHPLHETVKMNALFVFKWQAVVQGIHEVCLARTHTTPEIQALDRGFIRRTYQFLQRSEDTGPHLTDVNKVIIQALGMRDGTLLGGITAKSLLPKVRFISFHRYHIFFSRCALGLLRKPIIGTLLVSQGGIKNSIMAPSLSIQD